MRDIPTQKQQLRAAIRERIGMMNARAKASEARSLCRRIMQLLPPAPAHIAAYVPLADEVDIREALRSMLSAGHTLYLPRFEDGALAFRQSADLATLRPGRFDIPEPSASAPLLDPAGTAIILVPGRAFTARGERLGRGNGGYDIWLRAARVQGCVARVIGVCYECQIVASVPHAAHDERVDSILTARGCTAAR